ncbi:hypothetical protein CWN98_17225 [Vibrio splendidus]|uniref:hypothetical protein n=1 Tax=Vibrio splendidus TaxID=29497 RepID=UPI000D396033|nr:hypothetical protein [Vibrio splendidus]PTO84333.1 hypothetical protein CWN98_17225 [Vibrio splendidus]PTP45352.1 hypothetical protein CWO10_16940 [Vibrio splendidus]
MSKNIVIVAIISLMISGCVYSNYATKLENPISKPSFEQNLSEKFQSILSVDENVQTTSIGDDLFVVQRYIAVTEAYERIPYLAPTRNRFPKDASWTATYLYNDGTSGDLLVYTSPEYYQGQIGVILDTDYVVSTEEPLVQVKGAKQGRRWKLQGNGKFFKSGKNYSKRNVEKTWGLRFGGVNNGMYIFEIINRTDSTVVEVLQTIKVTEQDFLAGFVVRDIFVKGIQEYQSGIIQFKASDRKA